MNFVDDVDNSEEEKIKDLKYQIAILIQSIYDEGFIFKNPGFSQEQEWRLFRKVRGSNFTFEEGVDGYGYAEFLEGVFADNNKYLGDFTRSKLKFRSTETDVRTYFELGFKKIRKNIIKEIVLGPKCNIEPFDLKLLLAKNKYIENVSSNEIIVRKSNVPYV